MSDPMGLTADAEHLYVAGRQREGWRLMALDPGSGEIRWSIPAKARPIWLDARSAWKVAESSPAYWTIYE